jgi:hypothetical protein
MTQSRLSRLDRWSGPLFVLLAFVSAASVSLPESSDPSARIRALYELHRTAYAVAQVLGLAGVGMLLAFVRALQKLPETRHSRTAVAGLGVAAAAVSTNVAVLVLCAAPPMSNRGIHRAAVATDVTDDILFVAFAAFSAALALAQLPALMRALLALAAGLSLARALEPWWSGPGLDVTAPLVTLIALLAVGVRVLRTDEDATAAQPGVVRRRRAVTG